MKLLLVHNYYQQPGGEDQVFRNEVNLLRSAGHQVIEYVRHNDEIRNHEVRSTFSLSLRAIWAWDSARDLREIVARQKPQAVHFHNTFPLISPAAYFTCCQAGVPVIQTLHNYRFACPAGTFIRKGRPCEECVTHNLTRSVWHACYRESRAATAVVATMLEFHRLRRTWNTQVQAYICLSEFQRRKLIAGGLPGERTFVKPNFVSPDPGARFQEQLGPAIFVGRLSQEKGLGTLVRAWEILSPDKQLRIIGDGDLRPDLQRFIENRGLSNVRFEGRCRHEDVLAAIKAARFLVLPSECYEGLAMTIVEAFACGVPVIASRIGTMEEVIRDRITGLHFTSGDPKDLAEKVEWAWAHPAEMRAMGRNARAEYEAKYTGEKNYKLLMKIYSKAIADRSVFGCREGPGLAAAVGRQA
ncbi:MAG: glycosyltransferase family 4 protein [Candidatus Acidiferrales bacterium]